MKRTRILTDLKSTTLSKFLAQSTSQSEVAEFKTFFEKLKSLQRQLDSQYHTDTFFRDRLLAAIDIPAIQTALRDRLPRTSNQAVKRIENQLLDKSQSAGSSSACMAHDADDTDNAKR